MPSKIILLTGHRKSGTSMLHRLFDGHPGVNNYPVDISLYGLFTENNKLKNIKDIKKRFELIIKTSFRHLEGKKIFDYDEKFNSSNFLKVFWSICPHYKILSSSNTINRGFIILSLAKAWEMYAKLNITLPMVLKETSLSIFCNEIKSIIKNLKVIQIIRDPRDNYAAIKEGITKYYNAVLGEGEKETLASVINRSRMDLITGLELTKSSKSFFKIIKFEDLCKNPTMHLKKISNFCGIPFDITLLKPTIFGKDYYGNNHKGKKMIGISQENIGRWKHRISKFEAGVIEYWLGDIMDKLNYKKKIKSEYSMDCFSTFYQWYNYKYFYYDSFKN